MKRRRPGTDDAAAAGGRPGGWATPASVAAGVAAGSAAVETAWRSDGFSGLGGVGGAGVLPLAVLVALCATAPIALVSRRPLAVAVMVTVAAVATAALYRGPPLSAVPAVLFAWWMYGRGRVLRARAARRAREADRHAVASTLWEFTARGERARIASELHDVVAHHISMISVQAETARLTTPGMPKEGADRLLAIGDTARTALTEMRRLLGVLRTDAGAEPTRRPQPGLQQLLELIDETRDVAHASTRLIVRGRIAVLDPGVELAAYRIVQESLTNVRRHAPGSAIDVEVTYGEHELVVRVRDNGPGLAPAAGSAAGAGVRSGGHGLLGMRERAASVGGEVRTGPTAAGGFMVEAVLPATRLAGTGVSR